MSYHEDNYIFKIIILGGSGVGKTSVILRFVDDSFDENGLITLDDEPKIKMVNFEQELYKLEIWDTPDKEKFNNNYYTKADGIILAYDITEQNSFQNIKNWFKKIEENVLVMP